MPARTRTPTAPRARCYTAPQSLNIATLQAYFSQRPTVPGNPESPTEASTRSGHSYGYDDDSGLLTYTADRTVAAFVPVSFTPSDGSDGSDGSDPAPSAAVFRLFIYCQPSHTSGWGHSGASTAHELIGHGSHHTRRPIWLECSADRAARSALPPADPAAAAQVAPLGAFAPHVLTAALLTQAHDQIGQATRARLRENSVYHAGRGRELITAADEIAAAYPTLLSPDFPARLEAARVALAAADQRLTRLSARDQSARNGGRPRYPSRPADPAGALAPHQLAERLSRWLKGEIPHAPYGSHLQALADKALDGIDTHIRYASTDLLALVPKDGGFGAVTSRGVHWAHITESHFRRADWHMRHALATPSEQTHTDETKNLKPYDTITRQGSGLTAAGCHTFTAANMLYLWELWAAAAQKSGPPADLKELLLSNPAQKALYGALSNPQQHFPAPAAAEASTPAALAA